MRTMQRLGMAAAVAAMVSTAPAMGDVTLDNGVVGDGHWSVVSANAGDSMVGSIDPVGGTQGDVIFELFTYIDNGADGGGVRLSASTSAPAALVGGQAVSSGSFPGPNGAIAWTAAAAIPAGETEYNVTLSFTSGTPFGVVRVISYFDEDVMSGDEGDDVLVVLGTPSAENFFLLTLDQVDNIGIGHTGGFLNSPNATYIGWAADKWAQLQALIIGAGATYSIPGVVDTADLPPYNELRYPGKPAYGPRDITQAFAFDLNPLATSATIKLSLAGSPDGLPRSSSSTASRPATRRPGRPAPPDRRPVRRIGFPVSTSERWALADGPRPTRPPSTSARRRPTCATMGAAKLQTMANETSEPEPPRRAA